MRFRVMQWLRILHAMHTIITWRWVNCAMRAQCDTIHVQWVHNAFAMYMQCVYVRNPYVCTICAQHTIACATQRWRAMKSGKICNAHTPHFLTKFSLLIKVCLCNAHINLHAMLGSVRIHLHALPRNANAMMHLKQCARITKIMSNDYTHCRAMHTLHAFIAQQSSVRSATFAKVCILTLIYIKYNTYF